jgi:CBS domain-containing protein
MQHPVAVCSPDTNLAEATELIWKNGCGCLPVVGPGGNVIAMLTDRDICIALGTRDEKASHVLVRQIIQPCVFTCMPGDDIHCALKTLRSHHVRRLPVVDSGDFLQGILCMDDIVAHASTPGSRETLSFEDVVSTYRAICQHQESRRTSCLN